MDLQVAERKGAWVVTYGEGKRWLGRESTDGEKKQKAGIESVMRFLF